jgi:hypothetical protein
MHWNCQAFHLVDAFEKSRVSLCRHSTVEEYVNSDSSVIRILYAVKEVKKLTAVCHINHTARNAIFIIDGC